MKVRTFDDLRLAYKLLHILTKAGETENPCVDALHKEIRAYHRKPVAPSTIIQDNGVDGCIALQVLPEFTTCYPLDEARAYFAENMTYACPNSPYDCTGAAFTAWFKVFRRRNRWYAYHSIAFDV